MESLPLSKSINDDQAVLECPQCLNSCSPADVVCAGCGFRFRDSPDPLTLLDRTIHFDTAFKRRYTNVITAELGTRAKRRSSRLWAVVNLLAGAIMIAIGVFMAYAMPFGFECGMIFVFLGGILMLNVYLTFEKAYKRIEGCCPSCGDLCRISIGISNTTGSGRCEKCKKVFHFDGTRFEESTGQ